MSERLTRVPLFVEIAESLKKEGVYQRNFSESGIAEIMGGVITSLISNPEAKDQAVVIGGVEEMKVGIKGQRGTISGNVQVIKPVEAKIPVKFVLENSKDLKNLKLGQLSIGSGFSKLAIAALGKVLGVDIEAEAREKLKNPNTALAEAFSAELLPQGVKLTDVGLHFKDDALSVLLKGGAISPLKSAKSPEPAKPAFPAETSPADGEWMRKRGDIGRYLRTKEGLEYLQRTWDDEKWQPIGRGNGNFKEVYRPLERPLSGYGVVARENKKLVLNREAMESAEVLRKETQLLKKVGGKHFVKVYASSPFSTNGDTGVGSYKDEEAWDMVDFVPGISVEQTAGKWPESLTPAVRLSVLLAACECQTEVTNLISPAYLVDLKTDAFKVQPDGQIKLIDAASEKIDQQFGNETPLIALELTRLAVNLFRRTSKYSDTDVDNAIDFYLNPERLDNAKKFGLSESQKTTVISVFSECDFPLGLEEVLSGFLNEVRTGNLKPSQVASNFANRLLPIVQRTEREESAGRAEKLVAEKRREIKRRVLEKEPETWEAVVGEMIKSPYFISVFESTGSAIAAGAAYQMREKIAQGVIDKKTYLLRVNQAAKLTAERKRPISRKVKPEVKLEVKQLAEELGRDKIAEMAYNTTKSPVAAVVGYELSQEIMSDAIGKTEFINLVKLINALINGK